MTEQTAVEPEAVEPEAPEEKTPPMPGEQATVGEIVVRADPTKITRATRDVILSDDELRRTWRTAAALAQSRMFKDAAQAEQAFAKILVGRDLGISPTQALMSIDLVKGAIQLRGVLLASFVRESPTYHYRVVEHSAEKCRIEMLGFPQDEPEDGFVRSAGRWWEVLGTSEFTMEDAKTAKLVKDDSAWTTHPRNMLLWRAISNGVKFYAPDLMGGVPVYVEGEIPTTQALTEGTGDGSAPGIDLGPKVEAVLARAAEVGHAGLADRATAEMILGGQPPSVVDRWVAEANAELASVEADGEIADADVVDEPVEPDPERAETLRAEALSLADQADAAEAEGKPDEEVEALRTLAIEAEAEADKLDPPVQGDLGL